MFVQLARENSEGVMKAFGSAYWDPAAWNLDGLFWRVSTPPTFLSGKDDPGIHPPIDEDVWYVVLTEPSLEITTVWRLHEHGHELYVPIIRRRVKTGRVGRNGQKVTRLMPKPMFPGYGLIRKSGISDINQLLKVRGVREVIRWKGKPIILPHAAVLAIFRKQCDKHLDFVRSAPSRRRTRLAFKRGDTVKIEAEGSVYDGMLANVEKVDGKGRVQLLFGMIRHTVPAEMVVAA
jgi:transcription antitermination factor NusG